MTEKFYVAIENGRNMRSAKISLSRQRFQCYNKQFSQQQSLKKKICQDIFRVCRDTEFNLSNASQQDFVVTKKTFVTTTDPFYCENSVTTKVEKKHKRMSQHSIEYCNKVEELEEETSVTTKDKEERTEDCREKEIYVAT